MIKINPIKTIALVTALTAGTVCVAQNRMQGTTKPLVTVTQNQNGKEIYNELMKLIEHPEPKVVPGRYGELAQYTLLIRIKFWQHIKKLMQTT